MGIDRIVEVMNESNMLRRKQVEMAERQAIAMEKQNDLISEQTSIMRRSSAMQYLESEIWDMLVQLNLDDEDLLKQYYDYLCDNPKLVRLLFGLPTHLRHNYLLKHMTGGGDSS